MKLKSVLFSTMCIAAIGLSFTSCSDDDDYFSPYATSPKVFFLNEGSMSMNNATLAGYQPDSDKIYTSYFMKKNGVKLGDTGQDMIEFNDYIYIAMSGSKVIYKMDRAGTKLAALSVVDNPRSLTAKDGHIYVACYGAKVLKLDANTLAKQDSIVFENGTANLEGSVIYGNTLYVSNSYSYIDKQFIYNENLYTVDLATFKKLGAPAIYQNPQQLYSVNGNLYATCTGNYYDKDPELIRFNVTSGTYDVIAPALRMAAYNDTIFFANSVTDWSSKPYKTKTNFGYYDTKNGKIGGTFLKDVPAALSSASIYMVSINPYNGDFYIAPSDYTNTCTVYRFHHDGTLVSSFDAGGINTTRAIFFK